MDRSDKRVDCFAYNGWRCDALNNVKLPKDCENCRFKKPIREVTNGKVYPNVEAVNN